MYQISLIIRICSENQLKFKSEKQRKKVMLLLKFGMHFSEKSRKRSQIDDKSQPKNKMLQEHKPTFNASHNKKYEDELWDELESEYGKLIKTEDLPMSPSEFLRATNSNPNWVPNHGRASVKRLKTRMENGKIIDKPFLIFIPDPISIEQIQGKMDKTMLQTIFDKKLKNTILKHGIIVGHDGRHRSYVARKLGIEKIPVDIYCKCNKKTGCNKCKNITVEMINKAQPQLLSDSFYYELEMSERKNWDHTYGQEEQEKQRIEAIFKK